MIKHKKHLDRKFLGATGTGGDRWQLQPGVWDSNIPESVTIESCGKSLEVRA